MGTNEDYSQYFEETNIDAANQSWVDDRKKADRSRAKTPKDGEHVYRLLPKRKGAKHPHFFRSVYMHFLHAPVPDGDLILVGICQLKTPDLPESGHPCDICATASVMRKQGVDWKQLKEWGLNAQRNVFAGAVMLDNKGRPLDGDEGKPFIMKVPYDIESAILPLLNKESPRFYGDIAHPATGINIVMSRVGKTQEDTKYTATPLMNAVPLANIEWLKDLPDLDNIEDLVGLRARPMLGMHYPESGFTAPEGSAPSTALATTNRRSAPPAEDDEYELVPDPANPGTMVTKKELAERK